MRKKGRRSLGKGGSGVDALERQSEAGYRNLWRWLQGKKVPEGKSGEGGK